LHPLLSKWAYPATVCTKLSADLTGQSLDQDLLLEWVPFTEAQTVLYSRAGALHTALNWTVPWLVAVALVAACWWRWGGATFTRRGWRLAALAEVVVVVFGVSSWATLPKTEVRLQKLPRLYGMLATRGFVLSGLGSLSFPSEPTATELRSALANPANVPVKFRTNLILGGPIREEDSPGNYVLRDGANGLEILYYDYAASEQKLDLK
jgi:hypothetical protein